MTVGRVMKTARGAAWGEGTVLPPSGFFPFYTIDLH